MEGESLTTRAEVYLPPTLATCFLVSRGQQVEVPIARQADPEMAHQRDGGSTGSRRQGGRSGGERHGQGTQTALSRARQHAASRAQDGDLARVSYTHPTRLHGHLYPLQEEVEPRRRCPRRSRGMAMISSHAARAAEERGCSCEAGEGGGRSGRQEREEPRGACRPLVSQPRLARQRHLHRRLAPATTTTTVRSRAVRVSLRCLFLDGGRSRKRLPQARWRTVCHLGSREKRESTSGLPLTLSLSLSPLLQPPTVFHGNAISSPLF